MGRARGEDEATTSESEREIEGTGLCSRAQGDGVPCGGVRRLCFECGEAAPCTCAYTDLSPEEVAEILARAGM